MLYQDHNPDAGHSCQPYSSPDWYEEFPAFLIIHSRDSCYHNCNGYKTPPCSYASNSAFLYLFVRPWSSCCFHQRGLHQDKYRTHVTFYQVYHSKRQLEWLPSKADHMFLSPWHVLPPHPFFLYSKLDYFPKQPCEPLCQHPGRWADQNRKSSLERAGLFFWLQYWFTVTGEGWPQTDTSGSRFRLLRARPVFHLLSANAPRSLQPLPNLRARCSWLASAVTPWVAASGARGRQGTRRGEAGVPPCWGRAELPSWMEPHTPTRSTTGAFCHVPGSLTWFRRHFPVAAIKTNCN